MNAIQESLTARVQGLHERAVWPRSQVPDARVGQIVESTPSRPRLCYLARIADAGSVPCSAWNHAVVVPQGHPLTLLEKITLEDLVDYPIVTYHEGFTGRTAIDRRFADKGLTPDIVLSAIDADVIKTYVGIGLGIGIVAAMAYDTERDSNLVRLDARDLFTPNTTRVALRRGTYLRSYVYAFIGKLVPGLTEERIGEIVRSEAEVAEDYVI